MNDNGNPTGLAGTTQAADDSDDIDITVDDSAYNAPGNPLLAAALGALEQLTAAVESLAALKDSVRVRTRPILMTAFATAVGMIPIALERAIGLERLSPLAIVAIGGLMVSTFLTLLYVPIFYTIFEDITGWFSRLLSKSDRT